jgi:hypothetical protein
MPDKRDMHKAKSHRNSKSAKQQHASSGHSAAPSPSIGTATMTPNTEQSESLAPDLRGKKNKSRR